MKQEELIISEEFDGWRLDRFLTDQFEEYSRTYLQRLIEQGYISVKGRTAFKNGLKLKAGELLQVQLPDPEPLNIQPEDIPLDILYEDSDVILVNKPKGMVVHPAAGHSTGTLVNALLFHCGSSLSGINGVMRPGIVHRIDRDTTGVLIACKNDAAHACIAEQLRTHSITRRYYAIVQGNPPEEGTVDAPVGRDPKNRKKMAVNYQNGKEAVTHYRVIRQFRGYSWIECRLETGRTHQIRVHMKSIGYPLLGDTVYGSSENPFHLEGQALHAYILGFIHPSSKLYMEYTAPLPDYFSALLRVLETR